MANHPNTRIFLVDDDIFCLTLYEQMLKKAGYNNISSFNCGKDCLDNLDKEPQLVFLDYYMDDMNGLEVLRAIKKYNPGIIVVFISGEENKEVSSATINAGAFDFIVKSSINMNLLQNTIAKTESELPDNSSPGKKSFFGRMKKRLGA